MSQTIENIWIKLTNVVIRYVHIIGVLSGLHIFMEGILVNLPEFLLEFKIKDEL